MNMKKIKNIACGCVLSALLASPALVHAYCGGTSNGITFVGDLYKTTYSDGVGGYSTTTQTSGSLRGSDHVYAYCEVVTSGGNRIGSGVDNYGYNTVNSGTVTYTGGKYINGSHGTVLGGKTWDQK